MDKSLKCRIKIIRAWLGILERCYNSGANSYYWYGARGIGMCERWQLSVEDFIKDLGDPPTMEHSIDRINCNGDYEPNNCRWATAEEQNNNTRRSKFITWNSKTQTVRDWAKEYNIGARGLSERLRRGWDMEKSLTTPGRAPFEDELADRKKKGNKLWQSRGKLYSAKSKQRRGHKLSAAEQKAIEGHQEEMLLAFKQALDAQKDYEMRQGSEHQKSLKQDFLDWQ